jgi:prevent-host-death family protein
MTILVSMATVTVTELKARLSEKLRLVQRGEELLVTEHGRVVARILPARDIDDERLSLAKAGLLRLGSGGSMMDLLGTLERSSDPDGALLAALLAEREESR